MSTRLSFCILPHRGVLAVGGEDRYAFLHGLISNSIAAAGGAIHAALLTPQGKFLHEFFAVASGEQVALETEAQRRADLDARLTYFRLRAKVTLTISARPGGRERRNPSSPCNPAAPSPGFAGSSLRPWQRSCSWRWPQALMRLIPTRLWARW